MKRTVFVLGAGASCSYGFPTGGGLSQMICAGDGDGGYEIVDQLEAGSGYGDDEVKDMIHNFSRSGRSSIDAFLAANVHYVNVGKYVIAHCLCSAEDEGALYNTDNKDNWYPYLCQQLIGSAASENEIQLEQIRFISFNYDRSLEHYFYNAIRSGLNKSEVQANAILARLSILHVYGMLGKYGQNTINDARSYRPRVDPQVLRIAAAGINIVPEQRSSHAFETAKTWCTWAEQICFLGFGFDNTNVERLGLASVLNEKRGGNQDLPQIYMSTLHCTGAEINDILQRTLRGHAHGLHFDTNCLMTLRTSGTLL